MNVHVSVDQGDGQRQYQNNSIHSWKMEDMILEDQKIKRKQMLIIAFNKICPKNLIIIITCSWTQCILDDCQVLIEAVIFLALTQGGEELPQFGNTGPVQWNSKVKLQQYTVSITTLGREEKTLMEELQQVGEGRGTIGELPTSYSVAHSITLHICLRLSRKKKKKKQQVTMWNISVIHIIRVLW